MSISGRPWRRVRDLVLQRDHHTCQIQGEHCTGVATHADHIVSPHRGGAPLDPTNLRAACPPCNLERGANDW